MMMENLRRSTSTDSERKYQLISEASIKMFAESKGHVVSDKVVRILNEDVNYRLREIVSEASQYMKRAAQSCLKVTDVNHALADANVLHIYPHTPTSYTHVPTHKLYTPADTIVCLSDVVTSDSVSLPAPDLQHKAIDLHPTDAQPIDATTRRTLCQYFTAITEAVTGGRAELRKVALADIICNTRIGHIQQELLSFTHKWVVSCIKSKTSVHRALELLDALTNNKSLSFSSNSKVETITDILVNKICLGKPYGEMVNMLEQQQYASSILCKCLQNGNSVIRRAKTEILIKCKRIVQDSPESIHELLIGALAVIIALQPMDLIQLDAVMDRILERSSEAHDMQSAIISLLSLDCISSVLDETDATSKDLSQQHEQEILLFAEILRRHLPVHCASRLPFSADDNSQGEKISRDVQYLRRVLLGRAHGAPISHPSDDFQNFTAISLPSRKMRLNYGIERKVLKSRVLPRNKLAIREKKSVSNAEGVYNAWEALKQARVTQRSAKPAYAMQSVLFMTL
ncbi:TAF6-like RNA polymerase II p300/CBP-associated factor-associated factor 65 kDa subunit 6L [Watersipora subatra]|uniref:TAF6-like RNA polymerase II p300/CBP-associated factor-associated factor 65 kDa subunit 6L n=1 Tax=Watersipora subatra TaxID=2589382 RepID=UPI00355B5B20